MSSTPSDIVRSHRHFQQRIAAGKTSLQQSTARDEWHRDAHSIEWDVVIKNVRTTSDGVSIDGVTSEAGFLLPRRYAISVAIAGSDQGALLLALEPGQRVRIAGIVYSGSYTDINGPSFHAIDARLV
jgi:hypothetical protein